MNKDFFVGYLPMLKGTKNTVRLYVSIALVSCLGLGALIAVMQVDAGKGVWDPGVRASTTGLLKINPYPVLHLADGRSVLLVKSGKKSAEEFLAPLRGKQVAVLGVPIDRGGWAMLEVYSEDDVRPVSPTQPINQPVVTHGDAVSMQGEIVDTKCFLGVMKPGSGKVHRACAANCLTGGLPPMLVVTNSAGLKYGYMLITEDGRSASLALVPDVAVPVQVAGTIEVRGELTYLRIAKDGVQRIRERSDRAAGSGTS